MTFPHVVSADRVLGARRGSGLQDGNEMKEALWRYDCARVELLLTADAVAQG